MGLLRAVAGAPPVDALRMVCATLSLDLAADGPIRLISMTPLCCIGWP